MIVQFHFRETLIKSPVRPEPVEGHKLKALNTGVLTSMWFDRLTTNGLDQRLLGHQSPDNCTAKSLVDGT